MIGFIVFLSVFCLGMGAGFIAGILATRPTGGSNADA